MTATLFAPPAVEIPVIEFFVEGTPAPQGSHKAVIDRHSGRAIVVDGGTAETKRRHREWRKAVTIAAREVAQGIEDAPLDEPLSFAGIFTIAPIATDRYRTRHATTPDTDKLVRAVWDSLKDSGLIADDSRFFSIDVQALYARPGEPTGISIVIGRHGAEEESDRAALKADARSWRSA